MCHIQGLCTCWFEFYGLTQTLAQEVPYRSVQLSTFPRLGKIDVEAFAGRVGKNAQFPGFQVKILGSHDDEGAIVKALPVGDTRLIQGCNGCFANGKAEDGIPSCSHLAASGSSQYGRAQGLGVPCQTAAT